MRLVEDLYNRTEPPVVLNPARFSVGSVSSLLVVWCLENTQRCEKSLLMEFFFF